MNLWPNPSNLSRILCLSMFINHWETLLWKFICKAPNEPWQPTECLRPHKICGVSSTETSGDSGPGAMEWCLTLLCSGGMAGVCPQAADPATPESVDPIQRDINESLLGIETADDQRHATTQTQRSDNKRIRPKQVVFQLGCWNYDFELCLDS